MKTQNFESINTKLPPEIKQAFDAACRARGISGYDVLLRMVYSFLRTTSQSVKLAEDMRTIIQEYGRYEDDSVKLIAEGTDSHILKAVYIIGGMSKKASLVMTDAHLTAESRADVNIHHIFELILKIAFPDIYKHLTELRDNSGLPNLAATIRRLIDHEAEDLISQDIADIFSDNERAENGAAVDYSVAYSMKRRKAECALQRDLFEDQLLGQIFSRDQSKEEDEA